MRGGRGREGGREGEREVRGENMYSEATLREAIHRTRISMVPRAILVAMCRA